MQPDEYILEFVNSILKFGESEEVWKKIDRRNIRDICRLINSACILAEEEENLIGLNLQGCKTAIASVILPMLTARMESLMKEEKCSIKSE